MTHVFHDREDGLHHCKVCNGAEGSLPTTCPGHKMPVETEEAVYAGILDYKGGWVPGNYQRMVALGIAQCHLLEPEAMFQDAALIQYLTGSEQALLQADLVTISYHKGNTLHHGLNGAIGDGRLTHLWGANYAQGRATQAWVSVPRPL